MTPAIPTTSSVEAGDNRSAGPDSKDSSGSHYRRGMSQTPQPPQLGQVVNGHQWNGSQWVPFAAPAVGQISNGHQWNGIQWVPLPPPPAIGQVSNGHRWDGARWAPVQFSQPAPPAPTAPGAGHPVLSELHRFADAWHLTWSQKHDAVRLERVIAERKVMLGTAKLTYRATVTIDEARREVAFSELLAERGSGMSSGGDDGESSGFGFGVQTTSYNTHRDTIADNIEEQARQYSRQYVLDFPYARVREVVAQIAAAAGYRFRSGR